MNIYKNAVDALTKKFMNLLYLACFACAHRRESSEERSNQHSTNGIGISSPASSRVTVSNISIDSSVPMAACSATRSAQTDFMSVLSSFDC